MAMEHYLQDQAAENDFNRNEASTEKWKSLLSIPDETENNPSGSFECNICLDCVQDPVVTFCGHLYCWPCIYKWIHYQEVSSENSDHQQPQCPVCKAEVSSKSLIPLYGRGQTTKPSEGKARNLGIVIPRRPSSPRCGGHISVARTNNQDAHLARQLHHQSYPQQPQAYQPYPGSYMGSPMLNIDGMMTTNSLHPLTGMFGEMVYARIFGNSETTLYSYQNSYNLAGSSSPRMRRHIMQADRSLSRVLFFLFCCVVLCLLLF